MRDETSIDEGPVTAVTVTAGPFDLHRKYRSMEGPYVGRAISVGEMVASKNMTFPEGMVTFVEDRTSPEPASKGGAVERRIYLPLEPRRRPQIPQQSF